MPQLRRHVTPIFELTFRRSPRVKSASRNPMPWPGLGDKTGKVVSAHLPQGTWLDTVRPNGPRRPGTYRPGTAQERRSRHVGANPAGGRFHSSYLSRALSTLRRAKKYLSGCWTAGRPGA